MQRSYAITFIIRKNRIFGPSIWPGFLDFSHYLDVSISLSHVHMHHRINGIYTERDRKTARERTA